MRLDGHKKSFLKKKADKISLTAENNLMFVPVTEILESKTTTASLGGFSSRGRDLCCKDQEKPKKGARNCHCVKFSAKDVDR